MQATKIQSTIVCSPEQDEVWLEILQRFLTAVSADQRDEVRAALTHKLHTGAGLRDWLSAMRWRRAIVPRQIPAEVIDVYLGDSDVLPLYDCADCGIAIPVKVGRSPGVEEQPVQKFFASCPWCGGPTGWHLYCWKQVDGAQIAQSLRHAKPR